MIQALGVMIGLYIVTRYSEMWKDSSLLTRTWLVFCSIITLCLIWGIISSGTLGGH